MECALGGASGPARHFVTTFHNAYGHGSSVKRRYNAVMAAGERVIAISHFVADHVASTYGVGPDRLRRHPARCRCCALRSRFGLARAHGAAAACLAAAGRTRISCCCRGASRAGRASSSSSRRWRGWSGPTCMPDPRRPAMPAIGASSRRRSPLRAAAATFRFVDDCRRHGRPLICLPMSSSRPRPSPKAFGRVIVEAQAMGRPVIATDAWRRARNDHPRRYRLAGAARRCRRRSRAALASSARSGSGGAAGDEPARDRACARAFHQQPDGGAHARRLSRADAGSGHGDRCRLSRDPRAASRRGRTFSSSSSARSAISFRRWGRRRRSAPITRTPRSRC